MAITGLADGLRRLGHRVVRLGDAGARSPSPGRRLRHNLALALRGIPSDVDLVVGFDLDGFLLSRGPVPRVAALKGVAADEARFEEGRDRRALRRAARLERRAARTADRVVLTSEYQRRAAVQAYGLDPARTRVVPEGIDLRVWRSVAAERPGGEGHRVLSVARQYPRKNTALLLEAFAGIVEHLPGARLRVVGGGPELPALRRLRVRLGLEGSVDLLGEIRDEAALRAEYAAADLFCLPSLQEGFGIVFLEAMASGLPVVAARAAAAPEVVPAEAGVLVPPGDRDGLAHALRELLRDPGRRLRMGRAGRRHARHHDWPRVARRFLAAALGKGPATLSPGPRETTFGNGRTGPRREGAAP